MYPCVDIGLRLYYGWGCGSNPVGMGTVRDVSMQLSGDRGICGYGYIHGYPRKICGYGNGMDARFHTLRKPADHTHTHTRVCTVKLGRTSMTDTPAPVIGNPPGLDTPTEITMADLPG